MILYFFSSRVIDGLSKLVSQWCTLKSSMISLFRFFTCLDFCAIAVKVKTFDATSLCSPKSNHQGGCSWRCSPVLSPILSPVVVDDLPLLIISLHFVAECC